MSGDLTTPPPLCAVAADSEKQTLYIHVPRRVAQRVQRTDSKETSKYTRQKTNCRIFQSICTVPDHIPLGKDIRSRDFLGRFLNKLPSNKHGKQNNNNKGDLFQQKEGDGSTSDVHWEPFQIVSASRQ